MTKKTIQASCRKNKLYLTPHLNDVLYLHYSGYNAIEGLEEYVGLKCLWLECNAISGISGLDHQAQLRCLYLHNNLIKKIENLENCKQLDTLNLSHNHIAKIENCGSDILPLLNTLNISHNYLKSIESIAELRKCDFVSVLDISHNRIEDIAIVKVLGDMKGLRVLTMVGNPVVNDIPSYRKTLILECKSLTYLDSRPVFDKDRACAEAWKRGGYEEERKEHLRWKKEEQRKMRRSINATLRLRHRGDGEPELLKTSSDEEEEREKTTSFTVKDELQEVEYQTNEVAWKEMEDLFNQHTKALKPPAPDYFTEQSRQMCQAIESTSGRVNIDRCKQDAVQKALIEEITTEEYTDITATKNDTEDGGSELKDHSEALEHGTDIDDSSRKMNQCVEEDNMEILNDFENEPDFVDDASDDVKGSTFGDSGIEPDKSQSEESTKIADKAEAKIASAEQDDTLNVIIQSKEISITMQPSRPIDPQDDVLPPGGKRKPSTTSIDSIISSETTTHDSKKDEVRKASTTSVDYITGSDTNSDPTLVTDCDSCVRNSHDSSRGCSSDTSDSEDMFDKIVPKKHRKLACAIRSEISLSSSDSSSELDEPGGSMLDSKLDRQNTITEFIDEYKRFFHSVDLRDPKCVLKNRHKIVRPQTAKSQRTEPIVYEGVLKTMEQNSNQAKIEQVRQERETDDRSLAKEAVLERLMKGHDAVDMNLEHQMISIGGKAHNFKEYRLEVFRQDQEKLQNLIDRVTAQKDKYNAHIDSIHDQLANIMDEYGQISVKLRKVNDMIQNIGEEVGQEERGETSNFVVGDAPTTSIAEQIVENMTKEQIPDVIEANIKVPEEILEEIDEQLSSDESDLFDAKDHAAARIEVGLMDPINPSARKPIPQEFGSDPVYRKFIDIQYEIDKLTEDQIFDALNEAARELQEEEELEAKLLHDAVDEYWNPTTDLDDFRRNLNLDAHPIIQRFKRFIECQGTDTDDTDSEAHVRRLESAYHKYERRLSNHLFDEYLILSRKASIATTTGGESSATELELIEIEGGHVLRASTSRRTTAWDLKETMKEPVAEVEEEANDEMLDKGCEDQKLEELEDEESKPEEDTPSKNLDIKDIPEISDEGYENPKHEALDDEKPEEQNAEFDTNMTMIESSKIPDKDYEEPKLEEFKEGDSKPEEKYEPWVNEVIKDSSADIVEHQ
ncbi:dynein assembly factor 1, axonemal homolog isoform X2 [Anopheles stephensi]|nr:dynein assembly factor 1, axonemal homolog isoform X2 [Anopheles stephensi]XP_035908504.1 dynein assembly factor 1, axonemal homolog isoform X2 [Anopheles stephensi]